MTYFNRNDADDPNRDSDSRIFKHLWSGNHAAMGVETPKMIAMLLGIGQYGKPPTTLK